MRRYKKPLLLSLLLGIAFAWSPERVSACGCYQKPTVLHEYEQADAVLTARIISVEKIEPPDPILQDVRSATVLVQRVYKGNVRAGEQIKLGQGNGIDCLWTFDEQMVGEEELLYLYEVKDGATVGVSGCGRSNALERAGDDLLYLNNLEKARGRTRVSGSYGTQFDSDEFDVKNKKIQIIGRKKVYETTTDANGNYELYDLPPGRYVLRPEMPAGWKIDLMEMVRSPSYSKNRPGSSTRQIVFTLRPKQHAGLDLPFKIDNSVSGSVYDAKGQLITDACPSLVPVVDETQVRGDETCNNGHFKIETVDPGDYLLVLNQSGKKTVRDPYPTTYYPNVTDRKKAAVIKIGAGQSLNGLKMIVPEIEERITITGVLRYADNQPAGKQNVVFKTEKAGDSDGQVVSATDAAGRFSMKLLKDLPGQIYGVFVGGREEIRHCPDLEGRVTGPYELRLAPAVKLDAEHNVHNFVLRFPFACSRRAKRAP